MSADTEFRALLAGHAALTALVSTRIAANAVPQDSAFPLVVFVSQHDSDYGLDNTLHGTSVTHSVQCYATTAAGAEAVADAVAGAVATDADYLVTARSGGYDEELALDAVNLTVQRWIV
jgi:hypothetical protein